MPALLVAHRQPAEELGLMGRHSIPGLLAGMEYETSGDHLPVDQKSASNYLFEPA